MSETLLRAESQPTIDTEADYSAETERIKAETEHLRMSMDALKLLKETGASDEELAQARAAVLARVAGSANELSAPLAEAQSVDEPADIALEPRALELTQEPDAQLGGFKKGDEVRLDLDGKKSKSYDATIIKLSPDTDKIVVEYKRDGAKYRRWLTPAELAAMQPQESTENAAASSAEMGLEERAQGVLDALEASKPSDDEGDIAPEPVAEQKPEFEPVYKQNDVVKVLLPGDKTAHEGLVVSSALDKNGHEQVTVMYMGHDKNGKEMPVDGLVPAAALMQMQESRTPATPLDAVDEAIAGAEEELKKDKKHRWSNFKNWLNGKSGLLYEGTKERIRRHPRAAIALGVTAVGLLLLSRDSFNGNHSGLPLADIADKLPASTSTGGHTEIEHVTGAVNAASEVISIPDGSGGETLMKSLKLDPNMWYAHEKDFAKAFPDLTYRMSDGHIGLVDTSATGATSRYSGDVRDWWQSQR